MNIYIMYNIYKKLIIYKYILNLEFIDKFVYIYNILNLNKYKFK